MADYIVVFEWPTASRIPAQTEGLTAASSEEAKIQAALLYGCETFPHGLPVRYRVFDKSGAQLFAYPDEA